MMGWIGWAPPPGQPLSGREGAFPGPFRMYAPARQGVVWETPPGLNLSTFCSATAARLLIGATVGRCIWDAAVAAVLTANAKDGRTRRKERGGAMGNRGGRKMSLPTRPPHPRAWSDQGREEGKTCDGTERKVGRV